MGQKKKRLHNAELSVKINVRPLIKQTDKGDLYIYITKEKPKSQSLKKSHFAVAKSTDYFNWLRLNVKLKMLKLGYLLILDVLT